MKANRFLTAFLFLNVLTFSMSDSQAMAGQGKGETPKRGGQASEHMSVKALASTNAQWSADPERGWIQADERHNQAQDKAKPKQTDRKQKGNSAKGTK